MEYEQFLDCMKVDERTSKYTTHMLINKDHIVAGMPHWNNKNWSSLWLTSERELVIAMEFEQLVKELSNPIVPTVTVEEVNNKVKELRRIRARLQNPERA